MGKGIQGETRMRSSCKEKITNHIWVEKNSLLFVGTRRCNFGLSGRTIPPFSTLPINFQEVLTHIEVVRKGVRTPRRIAASSPKMLSHIPITYGTGLPPGLHVPRWGADPMRILDWPPALLGSDRTPFRTRTYIICLNNSLQSTGMFKLPVIMTSRRYRCKH